MKRIGNLWHYVVDVENGVQSVIDGTQFKRGDRAVRKLLYSPDKVAENPNLWHRIDREKAENYVKPIIEELENGTYRHHQPRYKQQFCKNKSSSKGKWRDLYIPNLKDHIVGHMVMNASMKAFTRGMHPNCCGSVPNRGIKHILKKVEHWVRDDKECRYFVKIDIRHFFDSIDRELLMQTVERKIKDVKVLELWKQIIYIVPESACPIGFYTSPWLSNLYLESFDWFVVRDLYKERRGKRIPYVRHYLRYADDMLLIGTSKSDLEKAVKAIRRKLKDEYKLDVKPEWEIKKIGKHEKINDEWKMKPDTYYIDIGGYKFCKDCTIMRDGVYLSTKRLAKQMSKRGYYTVKQCENFNAKMAWASHCNSNTFFENDIKPYVDKKRVKAVLSWHGKKQRMTNLSDFQKSKEAEIGLSSEETLIKLKQPKSEERTTSMKSGT